MLPTFISQLYVFESRWNQKYVLWTDINIWRQNQCHIFFFSHVEVFVINQSLDIIGYFTLGFLTFRCMLKSHWNKVVRVFQNILEMYFGPWWDLYINRINDWGLLNIKLTIQPRKIYIGIAKLSLVWYVSMCVSYSCL